MRLLTFQSVSGPRLGIKTSRGIIDVSAAHDAFKPVLDGVAVPETIETLCSNGETALQSTAKLRTVC